MAAVILLQLTASSLAGESVNEAAAINPVTYPPQAGKPETEAQQADTSKTNKIADHPGDKARQGKPAQGMPVSKPPEAQKNFNWSKHMPAAATRQHGEGVGYPGYRGQGGTGYPQHRQYGNPPRYPAADQATQSSQAKNDAFTGEANGSSPEHQTGTADPRRINTDKRRALLHAAAFGDLATLNELLEQGASPNARAKDRTGRSALILAAAGGHKEIVEALLENGARVDGRDKTGHTALNWAALRGRTQVAEVLLNKGADINTQDNNGVSPVHYAIGTRNIPMLKLLVANNANLEVEGGKSKMTPLLLAIELDDIESLNILLNKGVKVNTHNSDNFSPLMAAA
ncbi:MAG: ankyrin repeat domain-containing protein, partial [Gammaproteobacteria bacterium]|nr:ankyrin repeat domain-containing protein [Gammaproteobacteria bacterium]